MAKKKISGNWIDALTTQVDKFITLETTDGVVRQGRMTGFGTQRIILDGSVIEVLVGIQLNGDLSDEVPINRLAKITIE